MEQTAGCESHSVPMKPAVNRSSKRRNVALWCAFCAAEKAEHWVDSRLRVSDCHPSDAFLPFESGDSSQEGCAVFHKWSSAWCTAVFQFVVEC